MKVSIILAAGEGTRMNSSMPKVVHSIAGKPILSYVVDICKSNHIDKNIAIIGHKSEIIKEKLGHENLCFIEQPMGDDVPYGTGFAVQQAMDEFNDDDLVIVLTGDTPLFKKETLGNFINFAEKNDQEACIMTAIVSNPTGYGRIIRGDDSFIKKIVEEKDANVKEQAVDEVNTGIFAFKGSTLKKYLKELDTDNAQGELYLTDIIHFIVNDGGKVGGFVIQDEEEMLGINSRVQLAQSEQVMRRRINDKHMANGVTLLHPESTMIDSEVEIGPDTTIYPGAVLQGKTVVGRGCTIYGTSRLVDSTIGNNCIIDNSLIEESQVGNEVNIGPNAHLRPNSNIGNNVRIGNFVEVKNSNIGDGTKAAHLAYIGDADIGSEVNIGCGVIFVNYNGVEKLRSVIKDRAFIGSNTNIVAPITVGANAYIAAGSTITKSVEAGELSIERGEQKNIPGWSERHNK